MTSFYGEYREKDIMSDEEENRVSRANVDKWIFRLLLILIGFMPIIVLAHTKEILSPLVSNNSLLASGTKGDLFTYYKSLIVLIITIIAGLLLLSKIFFMGGKIRKTILNYFLGTFVFAIVMSTILSPNISIALSGQYNRSDGAISWLCYIALMFIAMNINYPKKAVSYVMYTLMPFVFINLFIISMNFTGNDLMQKTWMQKLVTIFLPEGANLAKGSLLVGTLNQWNYMSGMFAIMTVMYLVWGIVTKDWTKSVVGLITAIASMAVMLMSVSSSGFLTIILIMVFIIWLIFKGEMKWKRVIVLAIFLIFTTPLLHILSKENPRVWTESIGFFINHNPYIEEQSVEVDIADTTLTLMNTVYASDNSFVLPVLPERSLSAGSGRIYIWEKALELVKERPIFGYGLDTFMYNFPHFSIDARSGMADENVIVDKPHNTYVGIFYGIGLFGFIALISILITIGLTIFKNMIRTKDSQFYILAIASLAYFVQAMFNDSLPGISAVSWVIMGMMVEMNLKGKDEKEIN